MTKRNYAEEIARVINANEEVVAEVTEVNKVNGVIQTGISVKEKGCNTAPTIYIDQFYDDDVCIEDAAYRVMGVYRLNKRQINVDWVSDYEQVKGKLKACLYNASNANAFPVNISAKKYGFDDLIITARITVDLGTETEGVGSILVRPELLEKWGVTKTVVINQAIRNIKNDCVIKSMAEIMCELMGIDDPNDIAQFNNPSAPEMLVITNTERVNGAIAIIQAKNELKNRFPDGYTVLPSSIHEVIVVGTTENQDDFTDMVGDVNNEQVDIQEQLSNHAYIFNGEVA